MTDKVAMFYDPDYVKYDLGADHPLHQNRILLHYELCRGLGLLDGTKVIEPSFEPATEEQLHLVHTQEYTNMIRELSEQKGYTVIDGGDTSAFPGAYDITRLLVGGTLACVDSVMNNKVHHAWNPGGGLHHAHPDRASGFCIFNDVAIACRYLQTHYKLKRILYFDIDVHHSDGVQDIFYDDPGVLTLSIHETGRTLFPSTGFTEELGRGEGRGYSVNLPLPPYTCDEHYLKAFEEIVPPIIKAYRPEIIVTQNGVDTHFQDQLGHLKLTTHAHSEVAKRIHELAHKYANGRLVAVGGGGYSYLSVPRCWTLIFGQYAGIEVNDEIPQDWKKLFNKVTGLESPSKVRDQQKPKLSDVDYQRVERITMESVERVKQLIFPLLGIG
ncbi:MAG: acetoin utilization protein AcuC [Promethearchaeota archaeon]